MVRKVSPKKPLPPPALCCPVSSIAVQAAADTLPVVPCDSAWAESMRESERRLAGWDAGRVYADVPLWVGSHADALSSQNLRSRGIRAVVNVAAECGDADGVFHAAAQGGPDPAAGDGVTVLRLELRDHCDAPAARSFLPCAEFVARALERGDGVLIHCRSGVSRGPTFAVACLMLLKGVGLDAALDAVRDVRPQANPNLGFTLALGEFEQQARTFGAFMSRATPPGAGPPLSALLQGYRLLRATYDSVGQTAVSCLTAAVTALPGAGDEARVDPPPPPPPVPARA